MTYLLIRLTSLGNVAMTVPVVASLSRLYPDDEFVVVAQKPLSAMFYGMSNVTYHEAKMRTNGLGSILALFHELRRYEIDVVIDLQNNRLTRILRALFYLHGKPVFTVRHTQKECSEFDRYRQVLAVAGLKTDSHFESLAIDEAACRRVVERYGEKEGRWIGIAPFAKSKSNMLAYHVTKELIQKLSSQPQVRVYLFGAGVIECEMLRQWASIFPNVVSVAGELKLSEELELMRQLDVMLCMDSANQHLSSLVALRAVSVWCATHPKMGFLGWKQNIKDVLAVENLKCRPCTIHGTNKCKYRNFACREISAETILNRI